MSDVRNDLARTTLSVLFIVALLGASVGIVRPFLLPAFWAATLVIATWPLMCRVQRRLWNSRALAVTFMILVLLVVFVVPFWLAISTIVENSGQIVSWVESLAAPIGPPARSSPRSRSGREIRRGDQRPGLHGDEDPWRQVGQIDRCEPAIAVDTF